MSTLHHGLLDETRPESPTESVSDMNFIDHSVDEGGAQLPQDFDRFIEDELAESDEDAEHPFNGPDARENTRPNRFEDTAAQWRKFTSEERNLVASLDQVRAGDLSIHLYNAHVLKKRARLQEDEPNDDANNTTDHDAAQQRRKRTRRGWTPGSKWTAWPMAPELVPKPEEQFGVSTDDPLMARFIPTRPAEHCTELSEELHALLQRHAKEQWASEGGLVNPPDNAQDSSEGMAVDKQCLVMSADDEEMHQKLHPTVRSVLAKLDQLLLALHKSQKGYTASNEAALPEWPDSTEIQDNTHDVIQSLLPETCSGTMVENRATSLPREKTATTAGRPKTYEKREGETYYQMLKRLHGERSQSRGRDRSSNGKASEKLRPLPGETYYQMYKRLARRASSDEEEGQEGQQPFKAVRSTKSTNSQRYLRDWSVVLGMAAQQSFSTAAIDRAARRCSALFDEQMSLHKLGTASSNLPSGTGSSQMAHTSQPAHRTSSDRPETSTNTTLSARQQLSCPIAGCSRKGKPFKNLTTRRTHLMKAHGERDSDLYAPENDVVGGVHLDGFLQVIPTNNRAKSHKDSESE